MTRIAPLALLLAGCGAMTSARPLESGQHAVGLTLGGAVLDFGGPLPLPNAVVEGRHGLRPLADRPLDAGYGINLTALAFGTLGVHGNASWLLLDQQGARPALSVSERFHLYNNFVDPREELSRRTLWAINQLELTASWAPRGQLLYLGLSDALDLAQPELLLSPFAGVLVDPGQAGGLGVQLEGRWYGAFLQQESNTVPWIGLGDRGALGVNLGLRWTFGQARTEPVEAP